MDPALYHAHHSRHLEDLPFWHWLAMNYPGPILELGCGTGRVLLSLVKSGQLLVGLDRDHAMLAFLQEQLAPPDSALVHLISGGFHPISPGDKIQVDYPAMQHFEHTFFRADACGFEVRPAPFRAYRSICCQPSKYALAREIATLFGCRAGRLFPTPAGRRARPGQQFLVPR